MLWENGINGILADEMGLGKTIQCIAHIAMMIEKTVMGPFLVVAPLSTLPNWINEFKRFTPDVRKGLDQGSGLVFWGLICVAFVSGVCAALPRPPAGEGQAAEAD